MADPRDIAARLTDAQRRYLTTETMKRSYIFGQPPALCTFPPYNTYQVLLRLGLMETSGKITPLGLAVRRILQEQTNDR